MLLTFAVGTIAAVYTMSHGPSTTQALFVESMCATVAADTVDDDLCSALGQ